MRRSNVSGTISISNKISQFFRVVRFWFIVSLLVAATTTLSVGYHIGKKIEADNPGTISFFLKYELYSFYDNLQTNPEWLKPDLLRQVEQKGNQDTIIYLHKIIAEVERRMKWALISGAGAFVATILTGVFLARRERNLQILELFKRGALKFTARNLTLILKENLGAGVIRIGEVVIPEKIENLSFFFIGRPQQGKTQAILRILDAIKERMDRALIWCAKMEDFVTTHYDPQRDHIFCPGDIRSIKWSLSNDLTSLTDFDDVAARIIPETVSDQKGPWNKGAREILAGLMKYWWLNTNRSNASLWDILNSSAGTMYSMLSETPECNRAASLLERTDASTSHSFFITLMVYTKPFELLAKNDGDFSIRKYLRNGEGSIFILSGSRMKKSLQPVQTLFIDLFMTHHLDLEQDRSRRIWYFLDELPALNKLPKLEELLNVGPSYGASVVIGTQSFDLLDTVYEESGRRAIFNACNTATIFSVADDRTADELSTNIGSEEVNQAKQNYTLAVSEGKGSTSIRQEDKERVLYMPDEIKSLRPMRCIVRVLGYGVADTDLELKIWPQNQPTFVPDLRYSLESYEDDYSTKMEQAYNIKKATQQVKAAMVGGKQSKKKFEAALFEDVF